MSGWSMAPPVPPPAIWRTSMLLLASSVVTNTLFLGVTLGLSTFYFMSYRRDALWLKLLVLYCCINQVVCVAISTHWVCEATILRAGDFYYASKYGWQLKTWTSLGVFQAYIVQAHYIYRCWTISRNKPILATSAFLFLSTFGVGMAWLAQRLTNGVNTAAAYNDWLQAAFTMAPILDAWIMASFAWAMLRRRTGMTGPVDFLLSSLVKMSFQTSVLTALCALGGAIAIGIDPNSLVFVIFSSNMPCAASISLLITLLSRRLLADAAHRAAAAAGQGSGSNPVTTVDMGPSTLESEKVTQASSRRGSRQDRPKRASIGAGLKRLTGNWGSIDDHERRQTSSAGSHNRISSIHVSIERTSSTSAPNFEMTGEVMTPPPPPIASPDRAPPQYFPGNA